jgi:hypothetical protein
MVQANSIIRNVSFDSLDEMMRTIIGEANTAALGLDGNADHALYMNGWWPNRCAEMFKSIYGCKVEHWDDIPAQGKRAGGLWSTIRFIPPNLEGTSSTERSSAEKISSQLSYLFSESNLDNEKAGKLLWELEKSVGRICVLDLPNIRDQTLIS